MTKRITRFALALAAAAGLAACDSTSGTQTGQLTVQLTDAPFPYESVSRVDVWVVRIDARVADADEADAAADVDDDTDGDIDTDTDGADRAGGWVTIASPNRSINLLELRNGTTTNLGEATLPTGRYSGFRLILNTDESSVTLNDAAHTVLDGANGGIKFPSAHRTGIKVNLAEPIDVTEGGTVMVIDFDVANSFVLRGNDIHNNGLLFKPVLRATARDITGSVSGTVRKDSPTGELVPNATVQALKPGTVVTDTVTANILSSTVTDANGAFKFAFLLPGTYELRAFAPAGSGYGNALLAGGVTVAEGQSVTDKVIVLPKQ